MTCYLCSEYDLLTSVPKCYLTCPDSISKAKTLVTDITLTVRKPGINNHLSMFFSLYSKCSHYFTMINLFLPLIMEETTGADFTKGLKSRFRLKFKTLVLNFVKTLLSLWS